MKVLIAAQEEKGQEIARLLHSQGYATIVVSDGRSALKALQAEGAPRVAIFDWQLREMGLRSACGCARRAMTATSIAY